VQCYLIKQIAHNQKEPRTYIIIPINNIFI
jgi:hypothetical protein